jgi:hypothetical protein
MPQTKILTNREDLAIDLQFRAPLAPILDHKTRIQQRGLIAGGNLQFQVGPGIRSRQDIGVLTIVIAIVGEWLCFAKTLSACIFKNFIGLLYLHIGNAVHRPQRSRSLLPTTAAALPSPLLHP